MRVVASLCLLFVSVAVAIARPDRADDVIREAMKKDGTPALAACVLHRGKIIYRNGFGFLDADGKKPVTADTPFPIASLSKPMVAMAVLKLVEQRKLRLEAPIGDLLPDLPEAWRPIPLRRLLDHTSGIPSPTDLERFRKQSRDPVTNDEKLALLKEVPLRFPAGTRYEYSNGNYLLAALIVDRLLGRSHEAFMAEFMFGPLGMKNTGPLTEALMQKVPPPFTRGPEGPVPTPPMHPSWLYGCGAITTTVGDLAKWDAALYTERILRSNTLAYITTDQGLTDGKPVGYAMGWGLGQVRGNRSISHSGLIWGYRSYFARYADYDLTVVLLANQQAMDLDSLARNLAGLLVPELAVRTLVPIQDAYPELTGAHRDFITEVTKGILRREPLSPALAKHLDPQKTSEFIRVFAPFGPATEFFVVERSQTGPNAFRSRYGLRQGRRESVITITVDRDGTFIGLLREDP
ncbi:MAG: serine hydrolase domain-containing protein [Fimbriimonas sp.]